MPALPTTPPPPASGAANRSLQGLRGALALTVVLFHMHHMSAKGGFTLQSDTPWASHIGPYAVTLFFCISGFLIVGSLAKHGDVRRFAINRVARIYPLFILLHLLMFTLGPLFNYEWMGELRGHGWAYLGHFFSNLLFLPGMFDLPIAQKNAWSLSYEAAFYLLVGTIFAGRQRWSTFGGKLMVVLGVTACIEACVLEPLLAFFGLGVLVWWLDKKAWFNWPNVRPLSLLGCLAGLYFYSSDQVWLSLLAVLPFFVDVVRQSGWLAPILQTRLMVWLGEISFSLYLIHPFVLDPLRRIGMKLAPLWPVGSVHTVFIVVGISAAVGAAALTHALVEVRLTRLLIRR